MWLITTSVITRKNATFGDTPESLNGKQVGVLQGSLQEAYARAHLAKLGAQIKAYQSQEQNYADLQNGRLDATLTDKLEAQLGTTPEKGLSPAEAERRLAQYGTNEIAEKKVNPLLKFLSYFWGRSSKSPRNTMLTVRGTTRTRSAVTHRSTFIGNPF